MNLRQDCNLSFQLLPNNSCFSIMQHSSSISLLPGRNPSECCFKHFFFRFRYYQLKVKLVHIRMVGRAPEAIVYTSNNDCQQEFPATSSKPLELKPTLPSAKEEYVTADDHRLAPIPNWGYFPAFYNAYGIPYATYAMYQSPQLSVNNNDLTSLEKKPEEEHPLNRNVQESDSKRSRSRSRRRNRKSLSSNTLRAKKSRSPAEQKKQAPQTKQRPQKFMLKVIFTPLKRILRSKRLREMGIDMDEYFEVRGEPFGGHRTPADIELILWYVEQKYRHVPGRFQQFVEYLVENRRDLELYGQEAYGEKYSEVWLAQYKKLLNTIYTGIQTKGSSNARFQNLYSRRPSEQSFHNLRELKEQFYAKGVVALPQEK